MIQAAASNTELASLFCTLLIFGAILCVVLGIVGLVTAVRLGVQPGAALVVGIVLWLVWLVFC